MAGIITNVGEDIKSLQQLRQEIENVKKALGSIDINVKIDIRKELEQKLQALTKQYDTLVSKAAEADAKLMESAARIDKAVDTITKAQEKASKSTVDNADTSTTKAQVAAVEGQAKAYLDLKDEIDGVLGTREQNIRQMLREQNAIKLINAEIAQINKSRQNEGGLSATQSQRLQQLNDDLLTHKQALAEVRQELNNNTKLDLAAVGSMNELSQSLARMRIAYRTLNEDERNSQFGQNLLKSIQEADARIKELDATIGNHQRNVGNYQSFNGLNMSVQQIVRELPSATMGVNMFFMAISNNLPIMADQIKLAKEANKAMKAAGGEPVPVWKQLVSSLISWQTAMMVGITLLTVYGKDIANWVKGLFNAKTAISDLLFTQQQLSAAQKEARKDAISEQVKLKTLYATIRDTTLAMKDRLTAVEKLKKQYPSYFSQLSNEAILAGKAAGAYRQLAADILKAAQARAMEKRIEKLADRNFDLERYNTADKNWQSRNSKAYKASVGSHSATDTGGARAFVPTGVDMSGGKRDGELEREWNQRQERLQNHTAEFNRNVKAIELLTNRVAKIKATEIKLDNPITPKPEKNTVNTTPPKPVDYAKITREQSDAERELAYQVAQSRIDAEEDAAKREQMQRELNHKKELDDIEKQKNDLIQKHIANAKEIFEADPKNKDKKFDGSKITLTEAEQKQYDEIRANTIQKQQREDADYQNQQKDALNAYLKEYGSFEEKKLAITQDYEEKIRKASSVGEKATLEMQRDKEIEKAKNDDLQNSIDWNGIFSDLQGHTKQYLQGIRNQLQELLNTGNLPIDQMQTVSEKINAIDDELGKQQGIWDFVGERTREHNRLLKEAADAQERLNVAKAGEVGANANLGFVKMDVQKRLSDAGVEMNIGDISTANLNGKIDLTDEKFKGMVPLLQKLAVAEGKLAEARKKTADATNKANQKEDATKRKPAQEIADWFSDAQEFITKKGIDQLPDLLGSVGLGKAGEKVQKGLDGFNSAKEAAADFASGNYIGAAFKGISAIKSFGSALGIGAGNAAEVNRTTERLRESNEHLAERIDDLSDIIGDSAGAKAVNAYDTALKAQEEINKNNMEILKAQMGYHSGHHSNAYYSDDKKIASYNKDAQLAFKAAGVTASTINGLASIYNLTPEQLKAIKDFAPDLWRYLTEVGKYDKSEYWDAVVEQAGKTEKLTKQIQDNLTQTSFDSLRSGFLDTLMDMDSDAEDWSTNFSKMLFKSLVNSSIMGDEFDSWLEAFQEKWAEKIESGNMSKQDYADYRKEYNDKMQELKTQTNNLASAVGYDGTSSSQNATANGRSNISYDQADNLTGIMTSIQIAGEQRNVKLDTVGAQMTLMNTRVDDIRVSQIQIKDIANDTRDILANSYMELKEINLNTGNSEKHLKEMKSDISDMKRIIKDKL